MPKCSKCGKEMVAIASCNAQTGQGGLFRCFAHNGVVAASSAIGDVNGDGKLDLVGAVSFTAIHGNGSVAVLLGNGDGSFQLPTYYGTGLLPRALALADFNGDGAPDLASVNFTSNNLTVLLNSRGGRVKAKTTKIAAGQ